MRKNGFTLIELLAVIVILAIIALIATPIILGIINDAREKANERSVELYAAAVKNGIAAYQLTGLNAPKSFSDLTIQYDGDVKCTIQELYEDGSFYLEGCKVNNGTKEYSYGTKQGTSIEVGTIGICNPISVATEGTYTAGDKYECDVDPNKDGYDQIFYVLTNATSGSVNLIMDSNITRTGDAIKDANPTDKGLVAWITQTDYEREEVGGKAWDEWTDNNTFGPISAIEYLQEATKGWTKVNPQTVETPDNGETHNMAIKYTLNARMPYISEVEATGCDIVNEESGTCPLWMVDHLKEYTSAYPTRTAVSGVAGYWTLSSYVSGPYDAWIVDYDGSADYDVVDSGGARGVRPVINLSI